MEKEGSVAGRHAGEYTPFTLISLLTGLLSLDTGS